MEHHFDDLVTCGNLKRNRSRDRDSWIDLSGVLATRQINTSSRVSAVLTTLGVIGILVRVKKCLRLRLVIRNGHSDNALQCATWNSLTDATRVDRRRGLCSA